MCSSLDARHGTTKAKWRVVDAYPMLQTALLDRGIFFLHTIMVVKVRSNDLLWTKGIPKEAHISSANVSLGSFFCHFPKRAD